MKKNRSDRYLRHFLIRQEPGTKYQLYSRLSFMKLLKPKTIRLTTKELLSHEFNCPAISGYFILQNPEDFIVEVLAENNLSDANCRLKPDKIDLNQSLREVIRILGKPHYLIDNSETIRTHQILVYKRNLLGHRTTTQVHLMDQQVFCIVEDLKLFYISDAGLEQLFKKFGVGNLPVFPTTTYSTLNRDGFNTQAPGFYSPGAFSQLSFLCRENEERSLFIDFSVHLHFRFRADSNPLSTTYMKPRTP